MEKRPYSKSLRSKITNRTLFVGIFPIALIGAFSLYSLASLTSDVGRQINNTRTVLLDSVVGNSLERSASDIVNQLDNFMLERISDVVVWASAPVILEAAQKAAVEHERLGLVKQSIDKIEAQFTKVKSLSVSPEATRYLESQIRRSSHFGEIFFTDKNGFNTALTNPTSDFVQRDENWWKSAWENSISIGEIEYDESAKIWSVDISVRIDDTVNGQSLGVMKAVLGVSLIQAVADSGAEAFQNGSVTVINSSGQLLAETATEHAKNRIMDEKINLRKSSDPTIQKVFSGLNKGYEIGDSQVVGYAKSAGAELYRSIARRFRGFDWTVVVQQPTNIALAPLDGLNAVQDNLNRSKLNTTIAIGAASVLVLIIAILVAGFLSHKVTQPLMLLRDLADAASRGDITQSVAVDTDDEFQDLAKAFERMRTSLSIMMTRLKKSNAKS
jgi:methyl-accepting chemotaxis protein PixJ